MWLMPAILVWSRAERSSFHSMPRVSSRLWAQTCTEWQRPTVFTSVACSIAPVSIAIGLV